MITFMVRRDQFHRRKINLVKCSLLHELFDDLYIMYVSISSKEINIETALVVYESSA